MIDAFTHTKLDLIRKSIRRIDEMLDSLHRQLGQIEEELQIKEFAELEKELANDK